MFTDTSITVILIIIVLTITMDLLYMSSRKDVEEIQNKLDEMSGSIESISEQMKKEKE